MKSDIVHLNEVILQLGSVAQNLHTSFTKPNRLITRTCGAGVRYRWTLTVKARRFVEPLGTNPKET